MVFSGSAEVTSADGTTNYPANATVDCSTLPCAMTATITSPDVTAILTGDGPLSVSGPSGAFDIVDSGDLCDLSYIGSGPFTYSATATGLTFTRSVSGSGEVDCGDGTTIQYEPGSLVATLTLDSGSICLLLGDCATATPTADPTATPIALPIAADGPLTAATPSTLSTLPTVADALRPANIVWATALTVVLVIVIALPSHLFNLAIETGSDRASQWWRARRKIEAERKPLFSGWGFAAGGVLLASLISSFVDPSFGFNAQSPRVFASILVSFLLEVVVGWLALIWLVRRATPSATPQFRFVPATLIVVIAAVVFSRVTGFQPGIVFGLVAGVVFGSLLGVTQKARVTLVSLGWAFAIAVVGWVGYSILIATNAQGGIALFAQETLSAMAIGGIAALPIALVPLRGLAGYDVFSWNRWAWGGAYAIGLFGFFFVLMPMPFAWEGVPLEVGAWVGLFLLYAVLAVGTWLLVTKPWIKETAAEADDEVSVDGPAQV